MAWCCGRSYSSELRARVMAAMDGGMSARKAASVFQVSVSYVYKALIRRRTTGDIEASKVRGHRPRLLTVEQEAALDAHIKAHPDPPLPSSRCGWKPSMGCERATAPCGRRSIGSASPIKKRCAPPNRIGPTLPSGAGSGRRPSVSLTTSA